MSYQSVHLTANCKPYLLLSTGAVSKSLHVSSLNESAHL
jgi:hypothetical protein